MFLAFLACTSRPAPGPAARPVPMAGPAQEYLVRYGDSLFRIASRFSVPGGWAAIADQNEMPDPSWVMAGERLKLTGLAHPDLSPYPAYGAVESDLEACDTSIQEDVMGWPGVPASFCSQGLTVVEAQLDMDKPPEQLVGCLVEDSGVGMTTWKVALVDGPAVTQTLELANFGESSVVEGPQGCELLATSWESVPIGMSSSWHLVGRRMRMNAGALQFSSRELRTRRLLYSFEPGDVAEDLSHREARIRNIEPGLQGERVSRGVGVLTAGGQVDLGHGPQAGFRLGDASSRLLYPVGYVPPNAQGRSVSWEQLRVGLWDQSQRVAWF